MLAVGARLGDVEPAAVLLLRLQQVQTRRVMVGLSPAPPDHPRHLA
jgi:hypothetical protein